MKKKNVWIVIGLVVAIMMISTACGASGAESSGPQKIVIGIPNYFENVAFINEAGELAGYEVDLLKTVDEKLEEYEFEFQESNFDNILISLDSGKVDIGSHEFEYNDERAEKYLYGQEGYRDFTTYIMTLKGSGYTTLESLAGKTLGSVNANGNTANVVSKYNEEHPDQEAIKQDYFGMIADDVRVQSLLEGRWDAIETTRTDFEDDVKEYGDLFERGDSIAQSEAYFLYPKDGEHEALRDAVDAVVKELKESGELDELAQKWFGYPAYFED